MSDGKSLGQIAYEARQAQIAERNRVDWGHLSDEIHADWEAVARAVAHDLYEMAAIEADDQPLKPGSARAVQYKIRESAWGTFGEGKSWDFAAEEEDEEQKRLAVEALAEECPHGRKLDTRDGCARCDAEAWAARDKD